MGLFSSLFGQNTNADHTGQRLADICFSYREQNEFLHYYIDSGKETGDNLKRLLFSKDIIMLFIGASIVEARVKSHPKALQISDDMRRRYLGLISLPPMSLIGNCLAREDELELVAQRVAPGTPIQKLMGGSMSTIELMMVVCDIRSPQFRRDFSEGALLTQQRKDFSLWLPAAKSFLSQIRGISADSISFEDSHQLCLAIQMGFGFILMEAQGLFQ